MPEESEIQKTMLRCWGKTDPNSFDGSIFHPALYHMIDVGFVACELLSDRCSTKWQYTFSKVFNTDPELIRNIVPFFVALHDIGKISASFQRASPEQQDRLQHEGISFGSSKELFHTQVSRSFIRYEWPDDPNWFLNEEIKRVLGEVSAGHHGQFVSPGEMAQIKVSLRIEEPPIWKQLRQAAFSTLAGVFLQSPVTQFSAPKNISAAAMFLTGFTTLCDWIGSDQRFFEPCPDKGIEEYVTLATQKARIAVEQDGFAIDLTEKVSPMFTSLFSNLERPRPVQLAIDEIPDEILREPALIVIEAPTGEGKTEAALALAHRITLLNGYDEFYYALPTTATSNQMFLRVNEFLARNLNLDQKAKLIHGQAFLQQDALPIAPLANGEANRYEASSIDWFHSKKRALLAPFGVGTIDQIEIGALNVRHSSLRLAGLAGKVVIIDEVHAYDTYMTTIISRLLLWFRSLGTSVILLSATLPASRRAALLSNYHDQVITEETLQTYPLLIAANSNSMFLATPPASQSDREINLQHIHFSEGQSAEKARWLLDQVQGGGVACWITNTVNRAQEIYRELILLAEQDVELLLIHARFPLAWRDQLERGLMSSVGPDKSNRPRKMIVIGTQVLEQSLDIDFDVMVSDLAPIDLLLQRAGRLHRHVSTPRPGNHTTPVLYVNTQLSDEFPVIFVDGAIYEKFILLSTWQVIKDETSLKLPQDYRPLIDAVYNNDPNSFEDQRFLGAWNELKKHEEYARQEAMLRLLPAPDPIDLFTSAASRLTFTESETEAGWTVARTRLGEETINLIPLEDFGNACSLPGSAQKLPKSLPASKFMQQELLRYQIRVGHAEIGQALKNGNDKLPPLFSVSPLLRDYLPLWLHQGVAVISTEKGVLHLTLDERLGLIISKKGG